jgi:predicted nucleic acid-binding protein
LSTKGRALFLAEPPAQYLVRPPIVIDCSVFAAFVFQEACGPEALARMRGKTLHAPYLLTIEMASVALEKQQHGFEELAKRGIQQLEAAAMTLHAPSPSKTLELAARYKITAYDACYLLLATELKCPLLTFDERLGKAAQAHLGSLSS